MTTNGPESGSYDWTLLTEVESPLAEPVLEALAEAGIPAYAEAATGPATLDFTPVTRGGPAQRIWVDREHRSDARALVGDLITELRTELDSERRQAEDVEWRRIVSGFDSTATGDARIQNPPTTEDAPRDVPTRVSADEEWGDVAAQAPEFDASATPVEADEHFIPPEPPPLPVADPVTRAAWIGLVAGPLYLLLATVFDWEVQGLGGLLAVGAFVGGFVTLVSRMRDDPPLDPSDDDGAVV